MKLNETKEYHADWNFAKPVSFQVKLKPVLKEVKSLRGERSQIPRDVYSVAHIDDLVNRGRKDHDDFLRLLSNLCVEDIVSRNLLEMKGLCQLLAILNF